MRATTARRSTHARRGFTLLELIAVITILAILATFLVIAVRQVQARSEEHQTSAQLLLVGELIDGEYIVIRGDAPADHYEGLAARPANEINVGSESMVAALASKSAPWPLIDSARLGNTDDDRFPTSITRFETSQAFEYVDRWGNPVAYFHRRSYATPQRMFAKRRASGTFEEQEVRARRDEKTGLFANPDSYQLISAGLDGTFGTDDDVTNFEVSR